MAREITAMYFSPTGTTKKVTVAIARRLGECLTGDRPINTVNFTLPQSRRETVGFAEEDIVVVGVPVYAGRVPNILLPYLKSLIGGGALAVAIVLYGNRNYDDALIELTDILTARGFTVVAGGAFIGEHSFSKTLAQNRPDEKDMSTAKEFAGRISSKIANRRTFEALEVKGNRLYRDYYMPKNENNQFVDIRKVRPRTNSSCIQCNLCTEICPMGSIESTNGYEVKGICIKCGACIKQCPVQAKYYENEDYLRHKRELEEELMLRKEPEVFL